MQNIKQINDFKVFYRADSIALGIKDSTIVDDLQNNFQGIQKLDFTLIFYTLNNSYVFSSVDLSKLISNINSFTVCLIDSNYKIISDSKKHYFWKTK